MTDGNEHSDKAGERVAKVIARAGLASRREAEEWIAAGRVAINGTVIATPARNVTAADRISVDGEPLPKRERTRLFLYHKPRGLVTTHADPRGRATIFQRLPKHLPRLISVGRLDFNTEGLVLLTNDGGLARVLELPATGWLRRYRVRAHGSATQAKLDELRAGVTVDGIHYGPIEATLDRVQGSNLWLTLAIREGKNREVRNVLGDLGLTVTRLIRVSFGPFQLGELAEGAVEEVRTRVLREQLGERLVGLSGADFSAAKVAPPPPERNDATHGSTGRKPASAGNRQARSRQVKNQQAKNQQAKSPHALGRQAIPGARMRMSARRKSCGASSAVRAAMTTGGAGKNPPTPRAGLLTDRKGRRVVVERFESAAPPAASPRRGPAQTTRTPVRRRQAAPARPLMRVVGGNLRGRALAAPKSQAIRPTADRLRESLFNILLHAYGDPLSGARVLDLFAGTGALGIEALSRGAAFALFIDEGAEARALLRENVAALGLGGTSRIFRRDATKLGPVHPLAPFSLAFLDPPYGQGLAATALASARAGGWFAPDALIVVEEAAKAAFRGARRIHRARTAPL